MEVHGRIAGSSNATLLVTCRLGPDELLAVYKPFQGGAPSSWTSPAGSSVARSWPTPSSESLGWGLVPETVERPEGTFRPRFGAALRPRRGRHLALLHLARRAEVAPRAHAHQRLRRGREQRGPQEWPRAAGREPPLGHRQRPLLQPPRQAAHRDLGLRRRAARGLGPRGPGPTGPRRGTHPGSASCSSPTRWPPPWTGWPGCSACEPCPSSSTTATGPPIPGPSSSAPWALGVWVAPNAVRIWGRPV